VALFTHDGEKDNCRCTLVLRGDEATSKRGGDDADSFCGLVEVGVWRWRLSSGCRSGRHNGGDSARAKEKKDERRGK
jgi:hypothetical protein